MSEKENNFPPLPKFIPVKPCFYQNFSDEIPIEHQVLVKRIYHLWMCEPPHPQLPKPFAAGGGWEGVTSGRIFLFSPVITCVWTRWVEQMEHTWQLTGKLEVRVHPEVPQKKGLVICFENQPLKTPWSTFLLRHTWGCHGSELAQWQLVKDVSRFLSLPSLSFRLRLWAVPSRPGPQPQSCLLSTPRADSSFNFMAFFFIFWAQFVLTVIQAIGLSGWGACGWLAAIGFFQTSVGAAVVMLVPAIMFSVSAAMMAIAIMKVHGIYRGAGGSFQKAQTEWTTGTWRNPPSREAQYNNFSGNSLPEYPTVPNYPGGGGQWP
nr:secretory carrier-associated membrane protein 4 [Loxodonta africana]